MPVNPTEEDIAKDIEEISIDIRGRLSKLSESDSNDNK
jgi:pantothenate kinase